MTSFKGDPNRNKKTDVFIQAFVYKVRMTSNFDTYSRNSLRIENRVFK